MSDEVPLVCYDGDLCRLLGISLTTIKKLRRHRAFPIPELPALDKRHRYGRGDVLRYLNRETGGGLAVLRKRA